MELAKLKIAVLGGDRREEVLVEALLAKGAQLLLVGYPPREGAEAIEMKVAIAAADAIILPMSNTDEAGRILAVPTGETLKLSEEILAGAGAGTPLLVGMAKPIVKSWAQKAKLELVELGALDQIAILNAIPTAEGAVELAMAKLPITIWGSRALVLGFGRCGSILAKLLAAIGAETTVAARRASQLALAEALGHGVCSLKDLGGSLGEYDLIYNTIPAPVLTEELLAATKENVLIIDLASAPGGTDFDAAARLGREAILALGLPGKVAPTTAGRILADQIPPLICELVQSRA